MKLASMVGMVFCVAALSITGCKNEKDEGSMGAVGGDKACCASKDANMGAVSTEKKACCSAKKEGNMGAVAPASSCSEKKACGDKAEANMGAVAPASSCSTKKSCSDKTIN